MVRGAVRARRETYRVPRIGLLVGGKPRQLAFHLKRTGRPFCLREFPTCSPENLPLFLVRNAYRILIRFFWRAASAAARKPASISSAAPLRIRPRRLGCGTQ